ncbi:MAG TPA: helix-turn-helix domain-containing protein [Vicinamibacterales bacterium]|nr:helix-turn-helix domain-containing protein [Vicinamibacterales bacterium]
MGAHELAFVGLAGSGLGTAVGMPLVWPRSARSLDVRLLGAAVLLMSAIGALISARLAGLVAASDEVEHAINLLGLCTFPLLVFYTRYATGAALTRTTVAICLLPAALYLVAVTIREAGGRDSSVPFGWMLPVVLAFTIACAATLWLRGGSRAGFVPAEWLVGFVILLNIAQIVRLQFSHVPMVRGVVPIVITAGFLCVTGLLAWRAVAASAVASIQEVPDAAPRYERSGLEESVAPALLKRIDDALTSNRLFAQPELTLAQLAAAANCTPHQVSEVLNRFAGMSFPDLINRRRVADVKQQLDDPASERFTIEGIGASAGFGSRSALYAAFKRYEGTTPSAYRASRRVTSA